MTKFIKVVPVHVSYGMSFINIDHIIKITPNKIDSAGRETVELTLSSGEKISVGGTMGAIEQRLP